MKPVATQKENEQSEYANNRACCKAVLLFGVVDFCLKFVVNNHRLLNS